MSLKPAIKVLSLDAMDTIIRLRESPGKTYARFVKKKFGIEADASALNIEFGKALCVMEQAEPCYSFNSKGAQYWWQKLVRLTLQMYSDRINEKAIDDLSSDFFHYYSTPKPWIMVEPGVIEAVKNLRERNDSIRIAIVSNFDFRLYNILDALHFHNQVDAWFLSGEIGVAKPNVEIFKRLLRHYDLEVRPNKVIHIGDNVERDYLAPKRLGVKSLLFIGDSNNTSDERVSQNDRIRSLTLFLKQL